MCVPAGMIHNVKINGGPVIENKSWILIGVAVLIATWIYCYIMEGGDLFT